MSNTYGSPAIFRDEVNMSQATSVTYKAGSINNVDIAAGAAIERSKLDQEDAVEYDLPLDTWRVTATGALLGASAGTPAGAFGITYGTFGTAPPKIVGESASNNSKTDVMRRTFRLPAEYVAGETVTFRVRAQITAAAAVAQTIDVEAYEMGDSTVGSDLCTTAAQTLTTSFANYDFVITPSGLTAGDELDFEITGVANDTGGAAGAVIEIRETVLMLDIKG